MIAQDLSAFVDPGTTPSFEAHGNVLGVEWQVQGRKRDAMFTLKAGSRLRWVGPNEDDPYYAFLASDEVAGFSQLARSCLVKIDERSDFVASKAVLEAGQERESVRLTPDSLSSLIHAARVQAEEGSATQILFVKGDAGAGKTTLLQQTTRLQAERYLSGDSEFVCLYIPAQGRELSNLRDALAGELGELHAAFSHDAIACLAREGVLVPVVDGFDELLGTAGYAGAFSSLQTLLGELEGYGTLVVSARSAFYDIEFGRASGRRPDASMSISTAELQPWTDAQLSEYLRRHQAGSDPDLATSALARLNDQDRELLRRPFFASQFEDFLRLSDNTNENDLLDHLIDAYVEREAGKIVDAHGEPVLDPDGHRYLFELAVGEMWENGVRQLSKSDLRTIALLVAEARDLDAGQAVQLETKVTSYAGFRPRRGIHSSQSSFAFEHEVYFEYFLGCAMGRLMRESKLDEFVRFLDRGVVPDAVASASIRRLNPGQKLDPSLLRCSSGISFENRRRNLGSILLAYAHNVAPISDATVHGLSFLDVGSGTARLERVSFDSCQFIDVDLRGAYFENCEAHSSEFDGVSLDDSSHLDIMGLLPGINVKRIHYEPTGYIYDPTTIGALLERLGAPSSDKPTKQKTYSKRAQKHIALLERVARAFHRTTILYETEDRRYQAILGSPDWPELRTLMIDSGVIVAEERETKGANVTAYRLRANPDELLTGDLEDGHNSTAGLWKALQAL